MWHLQHFVSPPHLLLILRTAGIFTIAPACCFRSPYPKEQATIARARTLRSPTETQRPPKPQARPRFHAAGLSPESGSELQTPDDRPERASSPRNEDSRVKPRQRSRRGRAAVMTCAWPHLRLCAFPSRSPNFETVFACRVNCKLQRRGRRPHRI